MTPKQKTPHCPKCGARLDACWIGELETENTTLRRKCEDLTLALQQAIRMAQESNLPTPRSYNPWRAVLGWHAVATEAEDVNDG